MTRVNLKIITNYIVCFKPNKKSWLFVGLYFFFLSCFLFLFFQMSNNLYQQSKNGSIARIVAGHKVINTILKKDSQHAEWQINVYTNREIQAET